MKLELKNISKCYGEKKALSNINLELKEGIYGILGSNGAGKSTMVNLITDNVKRQEGTILFDGTEILTLGKSFRQYIGYMPQQQGLYEQFSGVSFLHYIAELKGIPKKQAKNQINELLQLVNLHEDAHRRLGGYSGGMKQRILLAQALLGDPKILILDEPTAGLDPKERIRLRTFIGELGKNKIVLLATHIVSDIESIADQILLMKEGHIVKKDTPKKLIESLECKGIRPLYERFNLEDVYLYYLEGNNKL